VDPSGLPKDDALAAAVERVAKDLEALLRAPEAEPFVGPAIFSGRAAGVFFHEIFGHRIEGHRQKDENEGQTFTKSVGTEVLPSFLSVVFDPTRRKIGGIDLNGWYEYDDEGVKGRPVTAVENGVLKTFLMSRSPIHGVDHSNGHGRRQPGYEVVSRQSNLIVESSKAVSDAELRRMLLEEVKRESIWEAIGRGAFADVKRTRTGGTSGAGEFSEGLATFESRTWPNGPNFPYVSAYGFIDRTGSVVVAPRYASTYPFQFGIAKVGTKKIDWRIYPLSYVLPADPHYTEWNYIDRSGAVVASGGRN
jgi:hypothetical protein